MPQIDRIPLALLFFILSLLTFLCAYILHANSIFNLLLYSPAIPL